MRNDKNEGTPIVYFTEALTYKSPFGECRHSIAHVDSNAWVSPAEAEELLSDGVADLPMPTRQLLACRAAQGGIATMAGSIKEQDMQKDDVTFYPNIPLLKEWETDFWADPHADFWRYGWMRETFIAGDKFCIRVFEDIVFEKRALVLLRGLYASSRRETLHVTTDAPSRRPRPRGRPRAFDREGFLDEAVGRIGYHGGFLRGDWIQSDLLAEMEAWCISAWRIKNPPGRTWITDMIRKAEDRYESAKSAK